MTTSPAPALTVYRACIKEAAAQGHELMRRAIRRVAASLPARTARAVDAQERQRVHDAVALLLRLEDTLAGAYPAVLLAEFSQAVAGQAPRPGAAALRFSELELVDDDQVQEGVEVLRTHQSVRSAVDAELVPLNALVCAAQGLRTVQSDRNPLRPDTYVRSLRTTLQASGVAPAMRVRWLQYLGEALGPELVETYQHLCAFLRAQGVSEAGFQIIGTPETGRGAALSHAGGEGGTLLTVRALQRLLAGAGPAVPTAVQAQAQAPRPEGGSDFVETLPAAIEVLQTMDHVESVVQRLRRRESDEAAVSAGGAGTGPAQVRQSIRQEVQRPGQAIALEVVSLMVEHLAGDPRLLPSVCDAVRALEPALLRLALADPRFFSDRRHPARRFLDEVTTRSLAFRSEDEPGYDAFIAPLHEAVDVLATTHVPGAEPYEFALQTLDETWARGHTRERRQREKSVRALLRAEQRGLLAARLAREIESRVDLVQAPPEVAAFLAGPWPHVVAQAQLADADGRADPDGFRAVVPELLWSVLPHTTAAAVGRLQRELPGLVQTIDQGLQRIGYGPEPIARFLERLAMLHQRALKGLPAEQPADDARAHGRAVLAQLLGPVPVEAESWLVPAEQQQIGFMDSVPATEHPLFQPTQAGQGTVPRAPQAGAAARPLPVLLAPDPQTALALEPGSWFELLLDGHWSRWQLSWVSPHRTLVMFTGADGGTHSMTPRLAAAMAEAGTLRLVSAHAVVDGAFDAVADAALRNSGTARSD